MTDEPIHIVPVNDSAPHRDDGTPCWCRPLYERVGESGVVVIHHSADGRELREEGAA